MSITINMPGPQAANKVFYMALGGDIADDRLQGGTDPGMQNLTARVLDAMVGRFPNLAIATLGDTAYQDGSHPNFANNFDPYWGHASGIPANFIQEPGYTYLNKFGRIIPVLGNHEELNVKNAGETPGTEYGGYDDYFGVLAQGQDYPGQGNPGGRYDVYEPVFGDGKKYWRILRTNSQLLQKLNARYDDTGTPDSRLIKHDAFIKAQIAAADNDTASGPHPGFKQHIAVLGHHPFFNATGSGGTDNQAQLFERIQDYKGGIKIAIAGHYHYYMRMEPIRYVGSWATGKFVATYPLNNALASQASDLVNGVIYTMAGVAGTNKPNQGVTNPHTDHILKLINGTVTDPAPHCYGIALWMLEPDRITVEYVTVDDVNKGGVTDGPVAFVFGGGGGGTAPTARLAMNKVTGAAPLAVVADASGSTKGTAPIQDYRWHWGDGTADTIASAGGGATYPQIAVIIMENSKRSIVENGTAVYETLLEGKYQSLTKVWGVTHPSQPNYLALLSGGPQGKKGTDTTTGNVPYTADNLLRQLGVKGITKKVYAQDWNAGAGGGNYGGGTSFGKHDPGFLFSADMAAGEHQDFDGANGLILDIANRTLPQFCFIIPNLRNDGHDTNVNSGPSPSAKFGDDWLKGLNPDSDGSTNQFLGVDDLIAHMDVHGLVIVMYDEGEGDNTSFDGSGSGGGPIYVSINGPDKLSVAAFTTAVNLYGITKGIQTAFGLPAFTGTVGAGGGAAGVGQLDPTYAAMAAVPLGAPGGGSAPSANHTYATASAPGTPYHLVLTVTDTASLTGTTAVDVTATSSAVFQAALAMTPNLTPKVGDTETANAGGSTSDGTHAIVGYLFDWGDGVTAGGATNTTSLRTHAYTTAGTYTAKVTVYDAFHTPSVATQTVVVSPVSGGTAPTAGGAVAHPRGRLTATAAGGDGADRDFVYHVDLDVSGSTFDPASVSFAIDWDDGTAISTGSGTTYSHDYRFNHLNAYKGGWGKKRIKVTVTDANGSAFVRVPVMIQRDHTLVGAAGVVS